MMDTTSAWIAAIWTAVSLFVASNIEPMPGVWVAACSGALLSAFTGKDRGIGRVMFHAILAILVGVFASQILPGLISIPNARVGEAFFCALFAEKIVASIDNGSILSTLLLWRAGK